MDTEPVIRTSQAILESRQSRGGAWGFVANQDAVEPTCFVILARRHQPSVYVERALGAIENLQNKKRQTGQRSSETIPRGAEPRPLWF